MSVFRAILANVVLAVAALGYGSLLRRLLPRTSSPIDRLGLTLLGGLGLLGTLLFDVGQVWFSRTAILLVIVPGEILGVIFAVDAARNRYKGATKSAVAILPAIVVAGVLLLTAVAGVARPVGGMGNDAISYHFLGPKVWLRDGLIRPVLDQSHTAFPAIVESQFAALMALGGERAPSFFALTGIFSMVLIATGLSTRLELDSRETWWSVALILTMPAIYNGGVGGFIDVVYAAFVVAAARITFDAEQTSDYLLAGALGGFAAGTKYTGLVASVLLILVILLALVFKRNQSGLQLLKRLSLAGAVTIAIAFPVYLRNWIFLGCPIYPAPPGLARFFHVRYMPPAAIQGFYEYIQGRGAALGHGPLSLLLLPYNLTYHTSNFSGAGGIGLAPLALGPLGLISCRRGRFAQALAAFAFLLTIAWFFTDQESRFLIPVYVIAATFAVLGWRYAVQVAPRFGPTLSALVIACSLLYGLIMIGRARAIDLHAAVSRPFAEREQHEKIPFLASLTYLNGERSVTKVLILNAYVPEYYLNKESVKPVGLYGEEPLPEGDNLERIMADLHRLQVSHVLDVEWQGTSYELPQRPPDAELPWQGMAFSLSQQPQDLVLVFEDQHQRIYRVN
jgi:hypothetical protein